MIWEHKITFVNTSGDDYITRLDCPYFVDNFIQIETDLSKQKLNSDPKSNATN